MLKRMFTIVHHSHPPLVPSIGGTVRLREGGRTQTGEEGYGGADDTDRDTDEDVLI